MNGAERIVFIIGVLESDTCQRIEEVFLLDIGLVSHRILVQPSQTFVAYHLRVHLVGRSRASVTGLRIVELVLLACVVSVTGRNLHLQSANDFIFGETVQLEVVRIVLAVFVLQRQNRVETVVIGRVQRIIDSIVHQRAQRLVRISDRTVSPYTVEQVVHTAIGVLRRSGTRLDGAGVVGRDAHVELVAAHHRVDTSLHTLVARFEQDTLLVVIRKRSVVTDTFRTAGETEIVAVLPCGAEYLVLPVILVNVAVIVQRPLLAFPVHQITAGSRSRLIRIHFSLQLDELVSIHHRNLASHVRHGNTSVIRKLRLSYLTLLGGDNHDTVRASRTIDSGSGSIFQDVKTFDIGRVDGRSHRSVFHRKSVDYIKRRVVLCQRVVTTDDDVHRTARHTFA